ncbi:unnamed protein product [Rhizoctonia solani]|uniref:Uncharacterized protein n=1 Tax=Rhizoctonia solani TaxID=456999 RepID=A0A8H2XJH3_9AGAM|nr:unnamed protein product [Rhizoctonia solani]
MADYISKFKDSSYAEYWAMGGKFGVEVNDPQGLRMSYIADKDIVTIGNPSHGDPLPPVDASAVGGKPDNVLSGRLYYDKSLPDPLPQGQALATREEGTDDNDEPKYCLVFRNGKPGETEATNVFAYFQFDGEIVLS